MDRRKFIISAGMVGAGAMLLRPTHVFAAAPLYGYLHLHVPVELKEFDKTTVMLTAKYQIKSLEEALIRWYAQDKYAPVNQDEMFSPQPYPCEPDDVYKREQQPREPGRTRYCQIITANFAEFMDRDFMTPIDNGISRAVFVVMVRIQPEPGQFPIEREALKVFREKIPNFVEKVMKQAQEMHG